MSSVGKLALLVVPPRNPFGLAATRTCFPAVPSASEPRGPGAPCRSGRTYPCSSAAAHDQFRAAVSVPFPVHTLLHAERQWNISGWPFTN